MGSKHAKKRYFIVKYNIKPGGKFDEFVELSKKKLGPGKIAEAKVILDMVNREIVKCDLPGIPSGTYIPLKTLKNTIVNGMQMLWISL